MSENALQLPWRDSDQHSGGDDVLEEKAPVRKSSFVNVKNPLRTTYFVSFGENSTIIGTHDTTEDSEADKDTENGGTQHSSKKVPNDCRSDKKNTAMRDTRLPCFTDF